MPCAPFLVSCTLLHAPTTPLAFSSPSRFIRLASLASIVTTALKMRLTSPAITSQCTSWTSGLFGLQVHFLAVLLSTVGKCSRGLARSAWFVIRVYEFSYSLFWSFFHSAFDLASLTALVRVCAVGVLKLSSVVSPSFLSTLATPLSTSNSLHSYVRLSRCCPWSLFVLAAVESRLFT